VRDAFLESLEHLFRPVEGWGAFRKGARPAAVVFVLYRQAGAWMVPFVRRRADMRDHPGQVALPGGGVKSGESAWEAGQREVAEEIGVPLGRLVPLGAGEPIYAAVTNFSVVPFVAYLPEPVPPAGPAPGRRRMAGVEGAVAIPLPGTRGEHGLGPDRAHRLRTGTDAQARARRRSKLGSASC